MKSPWNKILLVISAIIGIIVLVVGIITRISGDTTGSGLVVVGCILLVMNIAAFSSQKTRSKV